MEWFTLLLLVLGGLFVLSGLKIINQYERGVLV
jgi:regulator of protease activity HflC (stomatin/prohibitin superfamily)